MKAFHDRCIERRLPPLDALVVHVAGEREGKPGGGYFRLNGHADPFSKGSGASVEALIAAHALWERQKEEVKEWGVKRRRGEDRI